MDGDDRLLMAMVMVMIMMVRTLLVVMMVMTSNNSLHLLSTTVLDILWAFRERIRSFRYILNLLEL